MKISNVMYRRNLKHSRVNNIFKFASQKMKTVFTVESFLEFDTCFHFEYSPDVLSFEAQPLGFKYQFDEKECAYTPDFLVVDKKHGERFIEVKPLDKTINKEFRLRFAAKQQQSLILGKPLILVTEQQIRINPILNNLKLLHRYSGFQSFTPFQYKLLDLIKSLGMVRIIQIVQSQNLPEGEVLASVLGLISHGLLILI
jgi:hypothetical protein